MAGDGLQQVEDIAPHYRGDVDRGHGGHEAVELLARDGGPKTAGPDGRIGSGQQTVQLLPGRHADGHPDKKAVALAVRER